LGSDLTPVTSKMAETLLSPFVWGMDDIQAQKNSKRFDRGLPTQLFDFVEVFGIA